MFERIVYAQVLDYLRSFDLSDQFQSAFRPGYSTQAGLLRLTDGVRFAVNQRKVTILVLLDFSKAFDSICHPRLLSFSALLVSPLMRCNGLGRISLVGLKLSVQVVARRCRL